MHSGPRSYQAVAYREERAIFPLEYGKDNGTTVAGLLSWRGSKQGSGLPSPR